MVFIISKKFSPSRINITSQRTLWKTSFLPRNPYFALMNSVILQWLKILCSVISHINYKTVQFNSQVDSHYIFIIIIKYSFNINFNFREFSVSSRVQRRPRLAVEIHFELEQKRNIKWFQTVYSEKVNSITWNNMTLKVSN